MQPTIIRPNEDEDQDRDMSPDELEDLYNQPAREDSERNTTPNPADLAMREAEGAGPYDTAGHNKSNPLPHRKEKKALEDKTGGGLYRHEGAPGTAGGASEGADTAAAKKRSRLGSVLFGVSGNLEQKTSNLSSNKKKIIFGVGLGGTALFVFIAVVIVLFASLTIPNFAEHIASWQFARSGRAYRQSVTQVNAEKIVVDSADDQKFNALKQKYESLRSKTWGRLDKWRPGLTYKNMQATGRIDYHYGQPSITGRERLEYILVDGTKVYPEDETFFRRVQNRLNPLPGASKEDKILAGKLAATIDDSLEGYKSFVRGRVNKKILADQKIKLHWWDKQARAYKNAKREQARLLELRDGIKRIEELTNEKSLSKPLAEGIEKGLEAQKKCLADDDCAKKFLELDPDTPQNSLDERARLKLNGEYAYNTMSDEARAALLAAADEPTIVKAAQGLSTAAAIAIPLCIIYDGSVEKSAGTVDAASTSAMRTFYGVASAGDQQKEGDTTSEAVGATKDRLGNTNLSNASLRLQDGGNHAVSTDNMVSAQASAGGTFSIIGALFGETVASAIDPIAEPGCPVLTDWRTGIALGAGEVALAAFTGGGSKFGSGILSGGVRVAVTRIATNLGEKLTTKQGLTHLISKGSEFARKVGPYATKQARDAAAIAGATLLARMIVISRMNNLNSGVAQETLYNNIADMGGNLAAGETCRKMLACRPMTQQETGLSDLGSKQYLAQKKSEQGAFERYISLENPDSLLVNMGVSFSNQITNKNGLSQSLASSANRLHSSLTNSSLLKLFNPFKSQLATAQAQNTPTDTNYQLVQWGWPEDELALIENDPNYFPLQNDVILEQSGRKDEIEREFGPCLTETIGTLLANKDIQRDEDGRVYENDGKCAPKKLSRNNPDGYSDLVFRWRLAKRNDNVLEHLTDIQNPTASNSASANPAEEGGGLGVSPDGFNFPLKTTKTAVKAGKEAPGWCGQGHPQECGTGTAAVWCFEKQTNCHHDYKAADIFAPTGTPVVAAKSGKVIFGNNNLTGGTGSSIAIMGDDNNVYWYGHLKSGSVKFTTQGQRVEAGTEIGQVGEDADAQNTPSHLHLDVQGPPATTREGCTDQACNRPPFNFLDIQPALVKAYGALPD